MVNDNDARFRSHVFLVSVGSNHAAWAARSWASCCRKAQELDAVMHDQLSRTTLLGYLDKTRVPRTLPWLLRLLVYAVTAPYCRADEAELLWTAVAQTVDEWWLPRHRGRAFLVGACFSSFEVHTDPEYQLPEVERAPIQGLAPEREFDEGLTPSALTLRATAVAASWLLMFAIHADGSWLSEAGRLVSSFEGGEPVPFATAEAAAEELLTLLDKPRATPDDARAAHRDAPQVSARACRILSAGRGGAVSGRRGRGVPASRGHGHTPEMARRISRRSSPLPLLRSAPTPLLAHGAADASRGPGRGRQAHAADVASRDHCASRV